MNLAYPYTIEPQEGGGYFVQFVDIEEAFTEGESPEAAAFNAVEVLSGVLAVRLMRGEDIPEPSPTDGRPTAIPSTDVQAALLIHFARGERSLADLARAMGTSWPAAARLENPRHWPTLKQLDRAARALGKRLVLGME
ncbi:MAG TPA: type II toxin-antitoxin system HicB family antitoxin [Methylococcus sp.]|nr:type II toxin-antitoxin system HicB family antitoxin [Methylococcus sp.]